MNKMYKLINKDDLIWPKNQGKMYKGTSCTIGVSLELKEEVTLVAGKNDISERELLRQMMANLPDNMEGNKTFIPVDNYKKLRAVADCHELPIAAIIDYWVDCAIEQSDHKKLKRWKK